ncbi:MAG: hypothetical protein IKD10_01555, partial [Lentisphaeria bacterium]|nr:hypothetical protein [Lentisphaeria bacterium]
MPEKCNFPAQKKKSGESGCYALIGWKTSQSPSCACARLPGSGVINAYARARCGLRPCVWPSGGNAELFLTGKCNFPAQKRNPDKSPATLDRLAVQPVALLCLCEVARLRRNKRLRSGSLRAYR